MLGRNCPLVEIGLRHLKILVLCGCIRRPCGYIPVLIVFLSIPFFYFFMYPYSLYSLHQQPQHGLHGLHGLPHQHQQHQRPTASTLAASAAPASVDKWPQQWPHGCPMPTIDDSLDGLQLAGFRRYGASGLLSTFNGTHTKE